MHLFHLLRESPFRISIRLGFDSVAVCTCTSRFVKKKRKKKKRQARVPKLKNEDRQVIRGALSFFHEKLTATSPHPWISVFIKRNLRRSLDVDKDECGFTSELFISCSLKTPDLFVRHCVSHFWYLFGLLRDKSPVHVLHFSFNELCFKQLEVNGLNGDVCADFRFVLVLEWSRKSHSGLREGILCGAVQVKLLCARYH